MYKAAIHYKGVWLAPGSVGLHLHQDAKLKELDQHLKTLEDKERNLVLRAKAAHTAAAPAPVKGLTDNGPDPVFMKLLEEGAHLDLERMPL